MEIYRITNLINGKKYVGQSIYSRDYYFGSGTIVKQSIKKYGKENFKKDILWSGTTTRDILDELERSYIISENTMAPIGYNICDGGSSGCDIFKNHPNKEQIKEKIRQSMLNSSKCKKPGKLNGRYVKITIESRNKIYELYNNGYSTVQITSHFKNEFKEVITRHKAESVIKEGMMEKLILTDEERESNRYNIEHKKLINYIEDCKNKNIVSYISKRTGHCRKAIREMLKKHNLYQEKQDNINKKIRIYLHL